jgi:hypothetical protein
VEKEMVLGNFHNKKDGCRFKSKLEAHKFINQYKYMDNSIQTISSKENKLQEETSQRIQKKVLARDNAEISNLLTEPRSDNELINENIMGDQILLEQIFQESPNIEYSSNFSFDPCNHHCKKKQE